MITNDNDTLLSYSKINIASLNRVEPTYKGFIAYDSLTRAREHLFETLERDLYDPSFYVQYTYYEGCDGVLDKPVIIAEGFDILGTESAQDLHDYWDYYNTISLLNSHGYDVFCVNFKAPDHTLQHNAEIIEWLIHEINDSGAKLHHFEGIYIGESMGGVIGRIALKELENQDYDHQIGLYISFDSPQKGAYIPLAIQYAVKDLNTLTLGLGFVIGHLTDLVEELFGWDIPYADVYQLLNSNAAKQLLVKHYNDWGVPNYNNFQDYLEGLGYPQNCRNISYSDGSNIASGLGITNKHFLYAFLPYIIVIPGYTTDIQMDGWFPTAGSGGSELIEQTKIYFDSWFSNNWDFTITASNNHAPLTPITYYNAPGGEAGDVTASIDPFDMFPFAGVNKFSFVPTASAIDYKNFSQESDLYYFNEQYSNRNTQYLINNNLIPFDDIYAKFDNAEHVEIKPDLIGDIEKYEIMYDNMYIQNRIIDKVRDFEAQNTITVGNDVSGSLQSSTHTKHIAQGDVIIKSGTTVTMQAEQTISFEPGFEVEEGATFEATVGINPCEMGRNQEKIIIPPEIYGAGTICGNATFETDCNKNTSIDWRLTGENIDISGSGKDFQTGNLPYGQYTLYCTKTTNKGTATRTMVVKVKCNNISKNRDIENIKPVAITKREVMLHPNPTNTDFTISVNTFNDIQYDIEIKDVFGKTVLVKYNLGNNASVNVGSLKSGVYFVIVKMKNSEVVKKLIKS